MKQLNRYHRILQNIKLGILFGFILALGLKALATEEEAESAAPKKVVYLNSLDLKDNRGRVNILVHTDGHTNGRGYVIELRPDCRLAARPWKELEVRDMEAQCFIDIKSIKFDQANEVVSFEGFEMDYDLHEKNMQKDPPETSVSCDLKNKKTFTFNTKPFCRKNKKKSAP